MLAVFHPEVKSFEANPDAKRLYDDLLANYNRLIRPVENITDAVMVKLRLKISQLIEMVIILHTKPYTRSLLYLH